MKKVLFLKNAAVLTVTSLLLRTIGIFFRVWLTGKIGAEGIGLYQVVFSVYVLASTFATTGIATAVTRLVTERLSSGDKKGAVRSLRLAICICLVAAIFTTLIILPLAPQIAKYLVKDIRAANALKILCLGLPFIGVCSCIRGYFLARRSTLPPCLAQIGEQLARILIIALIISKIGHLGVTAAAAAVMVGDVASEMLGAILLYVCFLLDKKHIKQRGATSGGVLREIVRISAPISFGRYLHTALRTAENLLTPICLSKYKSAKFSGMEQFGMIKGMALPLLLFPASILSSISTLLVTEITESVNKGNKRSIAENSERIIYITSVFGFWAAGIFFLSSGHIGRLVYQSREVGFLIKALSPLVPFMYLDLICDGILKGLDGQKTLFKTNVFDSAVRVILVLILVPKYGILGFLGVMLFSNLYTALAGIIRISKDAGFKLRVTKIFLKPIFSIAVSVIISAKLLSPITANIWYLLASAAAITVLYFCILFVLSGGSYKKVVNGSSFFGKNSI